MRTVENHAVDKNNKALNVLLWKHLQDKLSGISTKPHTQYTTSSVRRMEVIYTCWDAHTEMYTDLWGSHKDLTATMASEEKGWLGGGRGKFLLYMTFYCFWILEYVIVLPIHKHLNMLK